MLSAGDYSSLKRLPSKPAGSVTKAGRNMRKESPPITWEPLKSLCIFSGMRDGEGLHFISLMSAIKEVLVQQERLKERHRWSRAGSLSFRAQVTI